MELVYGLMSLVAIVGSLLVIKFYRGPHYDEAKLADYMADQLSMEESRKITQHIHRCGVCRERVEDILDKR